MVNKLSTNILSIKDIMKQKNGRYQHWNNDEIFYNYASIVLHPSNPICLFIPVNVPSVCISFSFVHSYVYITLQRVYTPLYIHSIVWTTHSTIPALNRVYTWLCIHSTMYTLGRVYTPLYVKFMYCILHRVCTAILLTLLNMIARWAVPRISPPWECPFYPHW